MYGMMRLKLVKYFVSCFHHKIGMVALINAILGTLESQSNESTIGKKKSFYAMTIVRNRLCML